MAALGSIGMRYDNIKGSDLQSANSVQRHHPLIGLRYDIRGRGNINHFHRDAKPDATGSVTHAGGVSVITVPV